MTRVWSGRQGLVAIAVLGVTAVWRGLLLKASYFNQDDYYLTTRAYHRAVISWDFLFDDAAGHVQPAQQLAYWLVAHHAPFEWGQVATAVLAVELLAVAVMWHLLSRLLPGRWVRLPLLAVFAWSPLTLVPTLWWSAAMGLWPPMLFMLLATLAFVRAQDRRRQQARHVWLDVVLCVFAVVVGLTWHERGILAIAVLMGVAIARSERTGWRRLPDAVARWWFLWLPLAALGAGYLVLHRTLTAVESQQATIGSRLEIVTAFVYRNTVPGLASGPWDAKVLGGAIVPPTWVEVLSAVLAVAAAVAIIWRGGRARWVALVMLLAYVAGDVLLLLLGRAGFGEIIGLDPRYTADIVAVAVLFAAVGLEDAAPLRLRPWFHQGLAAVGVLLYVAGSALTTAHLAPRFENRHDRTFVTNLRGDLAKNPYQVLVDRLAPPDILLPLLGKEALLSEVFAPLPEHLVFDAPTSKLRAVTNDGELVDVRIVQVASSEPGPDGACGYAVRTGETDIPLAFSAPLSGRVVVRLQVFIDREADYAVRMGSWTGTVHVVRGPQDIWLVVPADAEPYSSISVRGTGPATLCVVRADVGPPVAKP